MLSRKVSEHYGQNNLELEQILLFQAINIERKNNREQAATKNKTTGNNNV